MKGGGSEMKCPKCGEEIKTPNEIIEREYLLCTEACNAIRRFSHLLCYAQMAQPNSNGYMDNWEAIQEALEGIKGLSELLEA